MREVPRRASRVTLTCWRKDQEVGGGGGGGVCADARGIGRGVGGGGRLWR